MLKRAISLLTFILLLCTIVVVCYNEGCLFTWSAPEQIRSISVIDASQLTQITSGKRPSERSFLSFSYEEFELPAYDADANCYLICESMLDQVRVLQNIRCNIRAIYANGVVTILAYNPESYRIYTVETTTLPIVFLQTGRPKATPIGEKESSGVVTVLQNDPQGMQDYTATFKKRGGMSREYPKKSILIKLMDTRGAQVSASVLGFTENTEFALNSLYDDESKIRDVASLTLWKTISTTGRSDAKHYDFALVMTEVFINGTYAGLYGFQENVNLASFGLQGQDGFSIFKSKSHIQDQTQDGASSTQKWGEVELKESNARDPWPFFEEAFDRMFVREETDADSQVFDVFDRDNCIDYVIWCNLLVAEDNLWKNTVLVTDQSDSAHGKIYVVPWDADLTLGARFRLDAKFCTQNSLENAEKILKSDKKNLYSALWEESDANFQKDTAKRWFALRSDVLSEETLLKTLDMEFDLASGSGARVRDAKRWPDSAQCMDNTFIETFIKERLRFLDRYYQGCLSAED